MASEAAWRSKIALVSSVDGWSELTGRGLRQQQDKVQRYVDLARLAAAATRQRAGALVRQLRVCRHRPEGEFFYTYMFLLKPLLLVEGSIEAVAGAIMDHVGKASELPQQQQPALQEREEQQQSALQQQEVVDLLDSPAPSQQQQQQQQVGGKQAACKASPSSSSSPEQQQAPRQQHMQQQHQREDVRRPPSPPPAGPPPVSPFRQRRPPQPQEAQGQRQGQQAAQEASLGEAADSICRRVQALKRRAELVEQQNRALQNELQLRQDQFCSQLAAATAATAAAAGAVPVAGGAEGSKEASERAAAAEQEAVEAREALAAAEREKEALRQAAAEFKQQVKRQRVEQEQAVKAAQQQAAKAQEAAAQAQRQAEAAMRDGAAARQEAAAAVAAKQAAAVGLGDVDAFLATYRRLQDLAATPAIPKLPTMFHGGKMTMLPCQATCRQLIRFAAQLPSNHAVTAHEARQALLGIHPDKVSVVLKAGMAWGPAGEQRCRELMTAAMQKVVDAKEALQMVGWPQGNP